MSVEASYRFARVPEWVLCHDGLEPVDVRVFAVLDRYDGKACFPSLGTVGGRIGRSEDTVRRSIRRLVEVGAVSVQERHVKGRQTSNRYLLAGDHPLSTALASMQGRPGTHARDGGGTDDRAEPEQEDPTSRTTDDVTTSTPPPVEENPLPLEDVRRLIREGMAAERVEQERLERESRTRTDA